MSFIASAFNLAAPQAAIVTKVVEVVAVLGLAGTVVLYLEHRGAEKCVQNVEASNAKETKKEDIQHGKDVTETQTEGKTFETAKTEPIAPAPVITLGVCPTLHHKAGPSSATAGSGAHGEAEVRGEDQGLPAVVRWDTEPVVRAGHDADAQVKGLQDYILNVCRPQ